MHIFLQCVGLNIPKLSPDPQFQLTIVAAGTYPTNCSALGMLREPVQNQVDVVLVLAGDAVEGNLPVLQSLQCKRSQDLRCQGKAQPSDPSILLAKQHEVSQEGQNTSSLSSNGNCWARNNT